ncbi:MAG: MFS transporter [Alphaproteobacteria bacterium]|nr:MFS transporter [Alphaproteobacteria bacterium SS10]
MSHTELRSLTGLFTTMFIMGLSFGLAFPAIAIRLEIAGEAPIMIGAVAAMASVAILLVADKVPAFQQRFGLLPVFIGALIASSLIYLSMTQAEGLIAWFVLIFAVGAVNTVPWIMGEAWLNAVVKAGHRGRFMAIYAGIWGLGMALGPQLMVLLGPEGDGPFWVAGMAYGLAAIFIFIFRRGAPDLNEEQKSDAPKKAVGAFAMIKLMPVVVIYSLAGGLAENIIYAMTPVYSLEMGFGAAFAANMITAFAFGGIVLQYAVGWASDRFSPRPVMAILLLVGGGMAALLPMVGSNLVLALLLCFLFGGMAMSIYTLTITLIGHGIARRHLPAAHSLMVIAYTAGGLVGPWSAGAVVQFISAPSMFYLIAILFGACFLLSLAPFGKQPVAAELAESSG